MTERPNIILILTDHFRRDALGHATPTLTRLANEGVRFSHAYCASPLCQPARNCLITGHLPSVTGIPGNQSEPISPQLREDTFMQHLRRAGYVTSLVGKHHYIDRYGLEVDVTNDDEAIKAYGFDHVFQVVDDGENGHNDDEYTKFLRGQGRLEVFREALDARPFDPYHPFDEEDTAEGFIGKAANAWLEGAASDQPFYLNVGFIGPHPPFWHPGDAPSEDLLGAPIGAADSDAVRDMRRRYMAKCAVIDRQVERLVGTLERRGLLDNTVIVFTSDHGDCLGDFGVVDKRFFYESSVGVPLFFRGPGVAGGARRNGPRVSRALTSHLDLYPTILEMAGVEPPVDRRRIGRSLATMLQGEGGVHDAIIAELATHVMVRTGNWKLVYDPAQGGVHQLFNMANDPEERHNLAGVAGYEGVTLELVKRILDDKIRQTQFIHAKEEQRLMRVRTSF